MRFCCLQCHCSIVKTHIIFFFFAPMLIEMRKTECQPAILLHALRYSSTLTTTDTNSVLTFQIIHINDSQLFELPFGSICNQCWLLCNLVDRGISQDDLYGGGWTLKNRANQRRLGCSGNQRGSRIVYSGNRRGSRLGCSGNQRGSRLGCRTPEELFNL